MLKQSYLFFLVVLFFFVSGCNRNDSQFLLKVSNPSAMAVENSTIEITKRDINMKLCEEFRRVAVRDAATGDFLPSQVLDVDMNGELDILIFQPVLEAGETRNFELIVQDTQVDYSDKEIRTYSRFVPERTDDYAWENDRVAFRTYGPEAQRMVEESIRGGTLSSGIDCWLKKVDYPIINKWYKKDLSGEGSYHDDHGEGLDNFHVGASRGCGGTGIWKADEQKLYTSRNFSEWQTIAEGPLRTIFEFSYQPWEGPSGEIIEKKTISLDLGSNLMRIELELSGAGTEGISAGITLHENDGNVLVNEEKGWFSYWQPHGDSELGMGIVVEPEYLEGSTKFVTEEKDQSHLLVHLKAVDGKVVYYSGFGWKESKRFTDEESWGEYLGNFAEGLANPLQLEFRKP